MKTRELIEALKAEDPSGEAEVIAGNTPIYFVELQPAFYDGPLQTLLLDEAKKPYYHIAGYKVTQQGQKVRLHLMNCEDVLIDNPEAPVDLSGLSEHHRVEWQASVDKMREEFRKP